MEEFRKSQPESLVVHLNERKISSLSTAAVKADEYVLAHKALFPAAAFLERSRDPSVPLSGVGQEAAAQTEERVCFYCPGLERKEENVDAARPKGVGLIAVKAGSSSRPGGAGMNGECFAMFMSEGWLSLTEKPPDRKRGHGVFKTIILADVLPFSIGWSCRYNRKLQGVGGQCAPRPLHFLVYAVTS